MSKEFKKLTRHEQFISSIQNAVTFIMAAGLTLISIAISFYLLIDNPTGFFSPVAMYFIYTIGGVGALLFGLSLNRKYFDSRRSKPDVFFTTPELCKNPDQFLVTISGTRKEKLLENHSDSDIEGVIVRAVEELERYGLVIRFANFASNGGIKTVR